MEGQDEDVRRAGGAVWNATPEGIEADRAEKQAARERYAALWGDTSERG